MGKIDLKFLENLKDNYKPNYDDNLLFVPIRHHSPVCGDKIVKTVKKYNPDIILIEGPSHLNPLKDNFFIKKDSELPLAFYTIYKEEIKDDEGNKDILREAVYLPFAQFSPEFVALKLGFEKKIETKFIDLPFSQFRDYSQNYEEILNDNNISYSAYITRLCENLNIENFNELWEKYFEIAHYDTEPEDFISQFYLFCYYSRSSQSLEDLRLDGTIAREIYMINNIVDHLKKYKKIMVITGGFHTPALLNYDYKKGKIEQNFDQKGESESYIVPFSYDKLDERSGYRSGILFPDYNDQLFKNMVEGKKDIFYEAGLSFLHKFHKKLNKRGESGTIVNKIEAIRVMEELRYLRDSKGISTKELFDSVITSYAKGEESIYIVMGELNKVLTGDKKGRYTYSENESPIIIDFNRIRGKLKLIDKDNNVRREIYPYKTDISYKQSLFFHKMVFLNIRYAYLVVKNSNQKGDIYAYNSNVSNSNDGKGNMMYDKNEYLSEVWDLNGDMMNNYVDLIEASVYGTSIDECCQNKFEKIWSETTSFSGVTSLFIHFLKLEIEPNKKDYIGGLYSVLDIDQNLTSLVNGVANLYQFSKQGGELSKKYRFEDIYQKGFDKIMKILYFTDQLAEEEEEQFLNDIKKLFNTFNYDQERKEDLLDSFEILYNKLYENYIVFGGISGVLCESGIISEDEVKKSFENIVNGMESGPKIAKFLRGLFTISRHIFMVDTDYIEAMNKLFVEIDEDDYLEILPELRVAFTYFSPMEQDQIAEQIAKSIDTTSVELRKSVEDIGGTESIEGRKVAKLTKEFLEEYKIIDFKKYYSHS